MPCPCRSPAMPYVNSHMPCRSPALLQQCHVVRVSPGGSRKYSNCQSNSLKDRLFGSVPIPHFTVVGMVRCEEDWYASDNNLRGTPRGSRKKPNVGRQPTGRLSTAVLFRGLEKNGMVRAWNGRGMASVNQTQPHCVNQVGKTHSKPLAARHGRGTAWARHAMCESAFIHLCKQHSWVHQTKVKQITLAGWTLGGSLLLNTRISFQQVQLSQGSKHHALLTA